MVLIQKQFRKVGKIAVPKKISLFMQRMKRDIIDYDFYSGFKIEFDSDIQALTPDDT